MFHKVNLFSEKLEPVVAHGGMGSIFTKRLLTGAECNGNCNFIDYTEMPPGTTIGLHSHAQNEEEYYLVIDGEGQMASNGELFDVKPGDLIRNPPSGTHGLSNTGDVPIKLFVFELKVD